MGIIRSDNGSIEAAIVLKSTHRRPPRVVSHLGDYCYNCYHAYPLSFQRTLGLPCTSSSSSDAPKRYREVTATADRGSKAILYK